MAKKFRKMKMQETILCNEILKEVLIVHEGGIVEYQPGWNDDKVREEVMNRAGTEDVPLRGVESVRLEMFGRFRHTGGRGGQGSKVAARIDALERRLAEVSDQMAEAATAPADTDPTIYSRLDTLTKKTEGLATEIANLYRTFGVIESKQAKAEKSMNQIRMAIKLASSGAKIGFNEAGDPIRLEKREKV